VAGAAMDGGFVVRAATIDDLEGLVGLARMSGPGFTSLPDDAAYLGARLRSAAAAFGGDAPEEGPEEGARDFLLILEDSAGAVVGCAAVKAGASQVPDEASFINFHHHRPAGRDDRGAERLEVSRAFSGATEVGSLFVAAVARGGGVGRLLAQSRGFLLAVAPAQFGHVVIAELRGVVDAQGRSPFWDAVGARLFATTFEAADRRLGTEGLAPFVAQLPKAPIDVATLPDGARGVGAGGRLRRVASLELRRLEPVSCTQQARFPRTLPAATAVPLPPPRERAARGRPRAPRGELGAHARGSRRPVARRGPDRGETPLGALDLRREHKRPRARSLESDSARLSNGRDRKSVV